jgi:glycosyltransferase involved in cell wall biosynthesis
LAIVISSCGKNDDHPTDIPTQPQYQDTTQWYITDRNADVDIFYIISTEIGDYITDSHFCGLPVVAYDCPFGPSMIINHEVDGLLVAPDDEQQFANSLCRLMGDADLRQSMGRHAIASAQRFAAEQVMPQWKALFEREKRR